jgi:formylglycine-generating enzyme required for sulfatase activity
MLGRRGVVSPVTLFACAAAAIAHPAGDPRPLPTGALAAGATVTREQGIEFVTITSPGNAAWAGTTPPTLGDRAVGRGRVDYEYRIGRYEVTGGQWSAFFDAVSRVPGGVPFVGSGQPGVNSSLLPRGNISWRVAAIYCNWLHNDKGTTRDAFMSGAYDVSTFGYGGPNEDIFTDQAARSPGARFFVPTWDEWLKAVHFDPSRFGDNQPGWWTYADRRDRPVMPGEANVASGTPNIPLGWYENSYSPWGLFDTAGGMQEWTESVSLSGLRRLLDGSSFWLGPGVDNIGQEGADFPSFNFGDYGFRIAAAIPGPSALGVFAFTFLVGARQRRR